MSAISREELLTIMLFGLHIAKIDNNMDVWERKMLVRFAEAIHLTDEERVGLSKGGVSLSEKMKNLNTIESRQLLVKMLCAVCFADGAANAHELGFIEKVVSKLGSEVFVLPREEWGLYEGEVFKTLQALGV